MTQEQHPHLVKIHRALLQKLESMERAGISHLKKGVVLKARISPEKVSEPVSRPVSTSAAASPPPSPSAKSISPPSARTPESSKPPVETLPSLVKIQAWEASDDPRNRALGAVAREVSACQRCQELATTRTQTVFGVGNPYSQLVFCGEAPGADEDRLGEPFVGRAGQLLTDIIEKGMKLRREDVYILNILRCRPPGNRAPLPFEAAACREYLDRQLSIIKPKYICCLGAVAAQNLLQRDTPIGQLRGILHDWQGIKVLCTYHPAYLLRNPAAKKYVWDDIKILMAEMGLKW